MHGFLGRPQGAGVNFLPNFERHVFVCTNRRDAGHLRGCCTEKQSEQIRESMKTLAKQRGLDGKVRINAAGCLDQCEHGVTVVVYPEAVWYGFVTSADVTEIVESHLVGGTPVARLRLPPECINTPQCRHRGGVALGGIGLPRK